MQSIMRGLHCVIGVLILFATTTYMQVERQPDLSSDLVKYVGFYVFNSARCNPPNFEKIRWIRIENVLGQDIDDPKTDKNGVTIITGYIETIDDERIRFRKAFLKKNSLGNYEAIEFETVKTNGMHFILKGNFLKKSINEGGNYTVMQGAFLKYRNGEVIANLDSIRFSKYAEL